MQKSSVSSFHWACKHTWKRSAKNTAWCLLGCSIGDFGTILFFQITKIPFPVMAIMLLAILNGLITSIILETIILLCQNFKFKKLPSKDFIVFLDINDICNTKSHVKRCQYLNSLAGAVKILKRS